MSKVSIGLCIAISFSSQGSRSCSTFIGSHETNFDAFLPCKIIKL